MKTFFLLKKAVLFILCAVLVSAVVFGCANKDDPQGGDSTTTEAAPVVETGLQLVKDGISDYVIVYPQKADNAYIDAAKLIRDYIRDNFGASIEIKDDWLNTSDNEQPGAHEILLGSTNREESKAVVEGLKTRDWAMKQVGEKIAVFASIPEAITDAAKYFVETVLSSKKSEGTDVLKYDAEKDDKTQYAEYKISSLKFAGNDISEYVIVVPKADHDVESELAEKLQAYIDENAGVLVKIAKESASNEKEILIGQCDRDESRAVLDNILQLDVGFAVSGNKVVINAFSDEKIAEIEDAVIAELDKMAEASSDVSLEDGYSLINEYPYISRDVTINGVKLSSMTAIYSENDESSNLFAHNFAEYILTQFGVTIDVKTDKEATESGEYEVLFGNTDRTAKDGPAYSLYKKYKSGTNNAIFTYNDKYMLFAAGSTPAYSSIYQYFMEKLAPAEPVEKLEVTVKEKIVTEVTSITVKVMSYNVLNDTFVQNINQHMTIVKDYAPDVIGFQEVKTGTISLLSSNMQKVNKNYKYVFKQRGPDGEGTPVFYNSSKYELLESGTKWLSDTPDRTSKYEDSAYVRMFTYVILKEKKTGIKFAFVNTHLDYIGSANLKQMSRLLELTASWRKEMQVFYTADWNMDSGSGAYTNMLMNGMEDTANAAKVSNKGATCGSSRIDMIFTSSTFSTTKVFHRISDHKYSNTSSDHFPVYAEVVLSK
ncbi:MAG: hypothetical protein KBT31_05935 [Firmicutes bacterium]|nr:hypothetical protein [Candidatus Colimorpha enterica]